MSPQWWPFGGVETFTSSNCYVAEPALDAWIRDHADLLAAAAGPDYDELDDDSEVEW